MPLIWPGVSQFSLQISTDRHNAIKVQLDAFATQVENGLAALGLSRYASMLWQPWNLVVVCDPAAVWCVFSPLSGGVADEQWSETPQVCTAAQIATAVRQEWGWSHVEVIRLPHSGAPDEAVAIESVARDFVNQVERNSRLARLGDLSGVDHLEPYLRRFLDDYPDPSRCVFVMMRFDPSPQLQAVHAAIVATLAARNMVALRADDRDYTGELWSNIEVYLTGCQYGIAVFEDINQRDFNPNVSLELGYMMGRHKRCLILKEKRLPNIPADVVHRLYKPFDAYDIEASVTREVSRWIDVDLGL